MDQPLAERPATRRHFIRRGAAVAVFGATMASILGVPSALADDNDKDDRPHPPARPTPHARINSFSSDLSRVSDSATSGDFTSGNAGTDPLQDGRLRLQRRDKGSDEGRLQVDLRGAAANVSYDVMFWPVASGKARESLGTIGPTNKDGNLKGLTPTSLAGTNRVGLFMLVRHDGSEAGKDEFISSMGG